MSLQVCARYSICNNLRVCTFYLSYDLSHYRGFLVDLQFQPATDIFKNKLTILTQISLYLTPFADSRAIDEVHTFCTA